MDSQSIFREIYKNSSFLYGLGDWGVKIFYKDHPRRIHIWNIQNPTKEFYFEDYIEGSKYSFYFFN